MTVNNLFCSKMSILIWKNLCTLVNSKAKFAMAILLPIALSFISVGFRIYATATPQPMITFSPFKSSAVWTGLMKTFDQRREIMKDLDPEFQHSVFVPQNTVVFAPNTSENIDFALEALKALRDYNVTVESFSDCESLRNQMQQDHFIAGICIWNLEYDIFYHLNYTFVFPSELRDFSITYVHGGWGTANNDDFQSSIRKKFKDNRIMERTVREGLTYLQELMSAHFITKSMNYTRKAPLILLQKLFHYPQLSDGVNFYYHQSIAFFTLVGYLYQVVFALTLIMNEKEKAVRTYLKIKRFTLFQQMLAWHLVIWMISLLSAFGTTILLTIKWSNGYALFTHTGFLSLYMILLLYNFTNASFCIMVSSFCSKKREAILCAIFLWFILSFYFMEGTRRNTLFNMHSKAGYFYYNSLAFTLIDNGLLLEGFNEGLTLDMLFLKKDLYRWQSVLALFLNGICFFALALLFDRFNPGQFGKSYREFKRRIVEKRRSRKTLEMNIFKRYLSSYLRHDYVQYGIRRSADLQDKEVKVDTSMKNIVVEVSNLEIVHENVKCADSFFLNLYENESFILMGPNGSGKTSIALAVAGLVKPNSGHTFIDGYDVFGKNRLDALARVGMAFDTLMLNDDLTLLQQLRFHSRIKNIFHEKHDEIQEYIKKLKWKKYINIKTKDLSNAVQYQLAIICAIIGGSNVIILDSIDSGINSTIASILLNLLAQVKTPCTLFITSNSYALSQELRCRIGIISNGELVCCGTLKFLKQTFGDDFYLEIHIDNDSTEPIVTELIRSYIPNVLAEVDFTEKLVYIIERGDEYIIPDLLRELETSKDSLGIKNISIRETEINDIFIRVATEMKNLSSAAAIIQNYVENYQLEEAKVFSQKHRPLEGIKLFQQKLYALALKEYRSYSKKKLWILCSLVIPFLVCIQTIYYRAQVRAFFDNVPRVFDAKLYPHVVLVIEPTEFIYRDVFAYYREQLDVEIIDTEGNTLEEHLLDAVQPYPFVFKTMFGISRCPYGFGKRCLRAWFNDISLHTGATSLSLIHNAILKAFHRRSEPSITVSLHPLPFEARLPYHNQNSGEHLAYCVAFGLLFIFTFHSPPFIVERDSLEKLLQHHFALTGIEFWIGTFCQFILQSLISLPILLILFFTTENLVTELGVAAGYVAAIILCALYCNYFKMITQMIFRQLETEYIISLLLLMIGMGVYEIKNATTFSIINPILPFVYLPFYVVARYLEDIFKISWNRRYCAIENLYRASVYFAGKDPVPNCKDSSDMFDIFKKFFIVLSMTVIIIFLFIGIYEHWGAIRAKVPCWRIPLAPTRKKKSLSRSVKRSFFGTSVEIVGEPLTEHFGPEDANIPIDIRNVGRHSLQNVSFSVKRGEVFGILGPFGSGKTTLVNMMSGNMLQKNGRIFIFGKDSTHLPKSIKSTIALCDRKPQFLNYYTLGQIMEFYALSMGVPRKYVPDVCYKLAKKFQLLNDYDRSIVFCSKGVINKLAFAIMFIGNPKLLLINGYFYDLDPAAKLDAINILRRFTKKGGSVIISLTSTQKCERLTDRIGILVNGRFRLFGSLKQIQQDFKRGYALSMSLEPKFFRADKNPFVAQALLRKANVKLMAFVENTFQGAIERSSRSDFIKFFIPSEEPTLHQIFSIIQRSRESLMVEGIILGTNTFPFIYEDIEQSSRVEEPVSSSLLSQRMKHRYV